MTNASGLRRLTNARRMQWKTPEIYTWHRNAIIEQWCWKLAAWAAAESEKMDARASRKPRQLPSAAQRYAQVPAYALYVTRPYPVSVRIRAGYILGRQIHV
jgi:hypothetical protein